MRFTSTLCAIALIAPVAAISQTVPTTESHVDAGSRVRIAAPVFGTERKVGTVVSVTSDTLVLRHGASLAGQSVATSDITAIEISTGTHSRKAKGALWGTLLGAGTGAVLGYALYKEPKCNNPDGFFGCIVFLGPTSAGENAVWSGVGGAIIGGIAGTLFGMRRADTWVPGTLGAR